MTTVTRRRPGATLRSPHGPRLVPSPVRRGRREDATALQALSRPFVRTGALRDRPLSVYASEASDFLVYQAPDGTLGGCLGLRLHPEEDGRGPTGVLFNFCVARHMQGRGVGGMLLRDALSRAHANSLFALFAATTGGGALFRTYGFAPEGAAGLAPAAWLASLDPRRGAQVLARRLTA
ncbi:GNAT family N-acetyltransferase [Streptomyces sp. NPDC048603]|uniref:GNAT family N-acetyltransferase n=1 Tax=Streptomyces sp. NPDC048603 TaxID=3365577 RepID=UPI003723DA7E